jgi:hypothetical protein
VFFKLLWNNIPQTRITQATMQISRSTLVIDSALRLLKPLVRLLLRNGVAYPAFATALKKVFLEAAQDELKAGTAPVTDSAVSLLSGVHRRDVRNLSRPDGDGPVALAAPLNMASQVVARWLSDVRYLNAQGAPRLLQRTAVSEGGFDALVSAISTDIRPRAVLDELVRLGIVNETENGLSLVARGFTPQEGFGELVQLMQANLHDHIAAATSNLSDKRNFLEQAVYVDEISGVSADHLHAAAAKAWQATFKTVMQEAQSRFDHDAAHTAPEDRAHRVRFGCYFYADPEDKS